MAICPICVDERSANFEHVNFHQINRPEGNQLQPGQEDHWACKPCADLWLALSNSCPTCRALVDSGGDERSVVPLVDVTEFLVHIRSFTAASRDMEDNGVSSAVAIARHRVRDPGMIEELQSRDQRT